MKENWNEISIFSFGQNIDNVLNKKADICATFRAKHGLNKMQPFYGFITN